VKKGILIFTVSILALGLTLPAFGVDLTGKIGVGGLASPIKPVLSDHSDVWALGPQGKLVVKYGINKNFAVGLSGGFARIWSDTTTGSDGVGFAFPSPSDNASAVWDLIPIEANGYYSIIPDNPKFNPYVTLGLGVNIWKVTDYNTGDDIPSLDKDDNPRDDFAATEFTVGLGGGLEYFVTENIGINGGLRFNFLTGLGADLSTDTDLLDRSRGIVEGFAGVTYYIERVKDSDGDGIKDDLDACPLQPEDFDGFEDDDGCPDPDNDNDGIPDISDKCPNEPEDLDGFEDDDGCPDPDNDNDGVLDVEDNCPNEAGPASNYGCPIVDSDGDGVLDPDDRCPKTPIGVKVDRYGCPTAAKMVGKMVLEGVNFASGKAKFAPGSEAKLDELYESLKAYPDLRIEIQGYTDSWGKASANKALSEKRAKAVMNYLIDKGIASYRLKAVGYGEVNPIASNQTKAGRAKNRRIEILPLK